MCWNVEVSVAAAVYGYLVSAYLYRRKYSSRDPWYALFLATFTTCQLFDAYFWYLRGDGSEIPCTEANYYLSKYLLPPVVFFQPIVVSWFPSDAWSWLRPLYRVGTVVACLIPIYALGCTTTWESQGASDLPTLLWGGIYPPLWIVLVGVGFWAGGAFLFVQPFWAAAQILIVGSFVLSLLAYFDGSIRLISKMCTFCLLLSITWTLEPLLLPPTPAVGQIYRTAQPDQNEQQRQHHQLPYTRVATSV